MQTLTIIALVFYTISIIFCFYLNIPKKAIEIFKFKHLFICSFLLIFSVYIYPLSLFYISGDEPAGDIAQDIIVFGEYIPMAILLSSLFVLVLAIIFYNWSNVKSVVKPREELSYLDKLVLFILFIVCISMLISLSRSAGGVLLLVLKGYTVTELFIGNGHLAVAFEWMSTILLLYLSNAFLTKNRKLIIFYFLLLLFLILCFSVMGRRSTIVVIVGSLIMSYNLLYKRIKFKQLIGVVISGFLFLTYVGFLRGQSFEDITTGIENLQIKREALSEDENADLLYTLKTGNFAVPFETLPRIVSTLGDNYFIGFGYYSMSSISNLVPHVVWNNRPLPISNWYMREFYGISNLNEGRQFFLLTAPYMDFGVLGIILFAVFLGFIFLKLYYLFLKNSQNVLVVTFVSLFFGSFMNLISNDFLGFIIAFVKGYGFPLLVLMMIKKFKKLFFNT